MIEVEAQLDRIAMVFGRLSHHRHDYDDGDIEDHNPSPFLQEIE